MKRNCIVILLFVNGLLLAGLLCSCAGIGKGLGSKEVDNLFLEAKKDLEDGKLDSAEVQVKKLIDVNPNLAPAYNLLGEIYREERGLRNRIASAQAIRKAIELEPLNPVYHYNLGLTYLEQDFEWYARKEFEKAAELDSNYIEPWLKIGDIYKQRGIIYDEERYYRRAVEFYKQALKRDPLNGEALYSIALIFLQERKYDEAMATLDKIKAGKYEPKKIFLFRAYLEHRKKNYHMAEEYYNKVFNLMSLKEREIYEDIESLLSEEQKKQYTQLDHEGKTKFRESFWRGTDPDPSTEINERQLEHYSRIVYSDIDFSLSHLNVRGAHSDRGEICIKFGEPDFAEFELGDVMEPSKWIWVYANQGKPFSLVFEDRFMNSNYVIAYSGSTSTTIRSVDAVTPQIYHFDYGGDLLRCLHQIYEFKAEANRTYVSIVYAIPNSELKFSLDVISRLRKLSRACIDEKYIVFNPDWEEIKGNSKKKEFLVPINQTADSNLLVTELFSFELPAGDYQLAWSLKDSSAKKIVVLKSPLEVDDFSSDSLGLSSIILADKIKSDSKGDFVRQGHSISPNFNNTFYVYQNLEVYYEIYNLKKDWEGKNYYRSECAVVSLKKGKRGETTRTTIVSQSLESRSVNENEIENFSLSLMDARPGEYELVIKITDLNSKMSKERKCRFKLREG